MNTECLDHDTRNNINYLIKKYKFLNNLTGLDHIETVDLDYMIKRPGYVLPQRGSGSWFEGFNFLRKKKIEPPVIEPVIARTEYDDKLDSYNCEQLRLLEKNLRQDAEDMEYEIRREEEDQRLSDPRYAREFARNQATRDAFSRGGGRKSMRRKKTRRIKYRRRKSRRR